MNKRARNRLIGVTAIILAILAAVFLSSLAGPNGGPAVYKTVTEVAKGGDALKDRNITIGGPVVAGSWDKKTHPMRFTISDDKNPKATLAVVYNGPVPNTFGDGVVAIVTGTLKTDGTIEATELQTKCPEKEAKKAGAITVDQMVKIGKPLVGRQESLTGLVVAGSFKPAGSDVRFMLQDKTGASKIGVRFDGATPNGFKDGADVVVTGALDSSGVFVGTSVAMAK